MKIAFNSYLYGFSLARELAEDGHEVFMMGNMGKTYEKLGITHIANIVPEDYDYVVLDDLVFMDAPNVLCPSKKAIALEENRLETKKLVASLGIETIPKMNKTGATPPFYVRPHVGGKAIKVSEGDSVKAVKEYMKDRQMLNYDFEQPIDVDYEGYVYYTICEDEWCIDYVIEWLGEDDSHFGIPPRPWIQDSQVRNLPSTEVEKLKELATPILEHVSTLGGKYRGNVSFLKSTTGEYYFLEINSRTDPFDNVAMKISRTEWLQALIDGDINTLSQSHVDEHDKVIVQNTVDSVFPLETHMKYLPWPSGVSMKPDGIPFLIIKGTQIDLGGLTPEQKESYIREMKEANENIEII